MASLIYSRAELFDGYLARSELDVARQLQQLIGRLDAPRRSLLMGKLAAVSGKRAAPLILAWAASTMQRDLARLLAKNEGDAVLAFYRDLASAARMAAAAASGGAAPKAATEGELVAWLLDPRTSNFDWELLLRMPRLEELLEAVGRRNQRLGLACSLLGFNGDVGAAAARHTITHALGSLSAESLALVQVALGHAGDTAALLDLLPSAAASCSGDAAATPSPAPGLAEAAVGLALERFVGAVLGLYLHPDVQLVTRVLGVSPFQVLPLGGAGAEAAAGKPVGPPGPAISLELLRSVVKQVVALSPAGMDVPGLLLDAAAAAAAPAQHQGSWGRPWLVEALQAAAKAGGPASPAAELLSALSAWRKAAMLAGVPCVAVTATRAELAALSDGEAAAIGALAGRLEAGGRALEALVLPPAAAASSQHTPDLESVGEGWHLVHVHGTMHPLRCYFVLLRFPVQTLLHVSRPHS